MIGAALLFVAAVATDTIIVSPTGAYRTIGAGVAAAAAGDHVIVEAGVYREPTIEVTKSLLIEGRGGAIIDGENARELIRIRADSVTIRGLVLRNVGTSYVDDRAAINVTDASHCNIADNLIENGFFGIYLANSGWCRIERNV